MNIVAITNSFDTKIQLIGCISREDAVTRLKDTYRDLCGYMQYDFNNTYLDEEEGYAQVVNGLEQIEIRIGQLNSF